MEKDLIHRGGNEAKKKKSDNRELETTIKKVTSNN